MQKSKKYIISKLLALVIIPAILINSAGYALLFSISQRIIKKEIKQLLKSSLPETEVELLKIKIGDPNYRKFEKNEFFYFGRLYDVIKMEVSDGYMHIKCINDKKEELLFINLDELIRNTYQYEGSRGYFISKILSLLLFFEELAKTIFLPNISLIQNNRINTEKFISFITEVPTPPPEI
ncbi:MAG TPA: hypothetical protein PLV01_02525 [Candidatus Kapabacteria bacterium]|nr:hypothetical protein [Candidatus Kapabacteria bacterium]